MSDEDAFLRAIQANPDDVTAKLVYADWLDDRGEHEKAAYVRVKVRSAESTGPTSSQELRELRDSVPGHWREVFENRTALWDPVTMFALGRFQGFLNAFALCNTDTSRLKSGVRYEFTARLRPRFATVQEAADSYGQIVFGSTRDPVQFESLSDWEAEVRTALHSFLFRELGRVMSAAKLLAETDPGREQIVREAMHQLIGIITPTSGWRLTCLGWVEHGYAGRDLILEAADRVLFLHFSYSD